MVATTTENFKCDEDNYWQKQEAPKEAVDYIKKRLSFVLVPRRTCKPQGTHPSILECHRSPSPKIDGLQSD